MNRILNKRNNSKQGNSNDDQFHSLVSFCFIKINTTNNSQSSFDSQKYVEPIDDNWKRSRDKVDWNAIEFENRFRDNDRDIWERMRSHTFRFSMIMIRIDVIDEGKRYKQQLTSRSCFVRKVIADKIPLMRLTTSINVVKVVLNFVGTDCRGMLKRG